MSDIDREQLRRDCPMRSRRISGISAWTGFPTWRIRSARWGRRTASTGIDARGAAGRADNAITGHLIHVLEKLEKET